MIKITFGDLGSENPVEIDENDRGNWEVLPYVGESGCVHLVGFNGEDTLTIHFMPMQDGTASVVVVYSPVDSDIKVLQGKSRRRDATELNYYAPMEAEINRLLAQVCDYPEELAA